MRYGRFFALLLLFGLIAVPDAAFSAASGAAVLWWTRVLPALLPYLIAASLLMRADPFHRLPKRLAPVLLLPLGALGGYPVGTKISAKLCKDGALSLSDAQKTALLIDLPNPVFLISVVSVGMFHDPKTSIPLFLGIYGTALLGLIPLSRIRLSEKIPSEPFALSDDLPRAIGDGIQGILNIGGCIVFASVLAALIESAGVLRLFKTGAPVARAVLLGLFEMTGGAAEAAALPLRLPLRLALCAFFLRFGGISVALQSVSALPQSLPRRLVSRFLSGLLSAIAVFLITPLFCSDPAVTAMASGEQIVKNSVDLLSVSLASCLGLSLIFVFTFGLSKRKRTPQRP